MPLNTPGWTLQLALGAFSLPDFSNFAIDLCPGSAPSTCPQAVGSNPLVSAVAQGWSVSGYGVVAGPITIPVPGQYIR